MARTVDLSNPDNLLKWSDLTDSTSTDYVEGLKAAWDEVENVFTKCDCVMIQLRMQMSVRTLCLRKTSGEI